MFFYLSPSVVPLIVVLLLKPTEAVCSWGLTYRTILHEFANNLQYVCRSERTTAKFVKLHARYSCCAFNAEACSNAKEIYEYFYVQQTHYPSIHNMCYYNFFAFYYTMCDCQGKLYSRPPTNPPTRFPTRPPTRPPNSLSCGLTGIRGRIFGGQKAQECEIPWMARFKVGNFLCGGVLVDTRHILTAAHCSSLSNKSDMTITLSTIDVKYPVYQVGVESFIIHPQYTETQNALYNDIAILRLSKEVKFNRCIQPICLPDRYHQSIDTKRCFIAGWGEDETRKTQRYLLKVDVPILSAEICRRYIAGYKPGLICAGYLEGKKDACGGDSGGPLMCPNNGQWVVAGLVSYGFYCARPFSPGVYTDVRYYIDWIQNHIRKQTAF